MQANVVEGVNCSSPCGRRRGVAGLAGLIEDARRTIIKVPVDRRNWRFLPLGVTGNTPDSGSGESWFDPRRGNLKPDNALCAVGLFRFLRGVAVSESR